MSVKIKGVTVFIRRELLEHLVDAEIIGDRSYHDKVVYVDQLSNTEGTTRLLGRRVKVRRRKGDIWDVVESG